MTDLDPLPSYLVPYDHNFRAEQGAFSNLWQLQAPHGTTPEHVLRPDWWQHIAARITPGDKVEIHALDSTFYMEVLARSVNASRTAVEVVALPNAWTEPEPKTLASGGLVVCFLGEGRRWCLSMGDASGDVIRSGMRSRTEAADLLASLSNAKPTRASKAAA